MIVVRNDENIKNHHKKIANFLLNQKLAQISGGIFLENDYNIYQNGGYNLRKFVGPSFWSVLTHF